MNNWYKIAQNHKSEKTIDVENLSCPFCKESGFDTIGLKSHLTHGDCQIFNITATLSRVMEE